MVASTESSHSTSSPARAFKTRAERLAWEAKMVPCSRCKEVYHLDENGPTLCNYHAGPTEVWPRNQGSFDKVVYMCCGAHDVGQPVLLRSPGCRKGPHMDKHEHLYWRMAQKKQEAEKRMQQHELAQLNTQRNRMERLSARLGSHLDSFTPTPPKANRSCRMACTPPSREYLRALPAHETTS